MSITPRCVSPAKPASKAKLTIASRNTPVEIQLKQIVAQLQQQPCPLNSRRLKVVPHFRQLAGNFFVNEYKYVPKINLLGNWLEEAGFKMEGHVKVYTINKVLVICMEK